MLRILALTTILLVLSGCKIAVILTEGGIVYNESTTPCELDTSFPPKGAICLYEVSDTSYSETFTAYPLPGWEFVKWNSGGGFFCQNLKSPICEISNVGTAGIVAVEAIVASNQTFYVMPIFQPRRVPEAELIHSNGRDWAQPDLFVNLSWDDINAVCPTGICGEDAILNDYDLSGWTWASVADINSMFNTHIPGSPLGSDPDVYVDFARTGLASESFFNDGWRPVGTFPFQLLGLTSGPADCTDSCLGEVLKDFGGVGADLFGTTTGHPLDVRTPKVGAFFFR